MHVGIKTLVNISSQLHQHLEGKVVLIGKILNLDIPLEYFFGGNIAHSLGEVVEDHHPPNTSFLGWGELFLPPTGNKKCHSSFGSIFTRTLKDHLLWLREFA
jgi:hypothetical protein